MSNKTLERQTTNKYDSKNRKEAEHKSARFSVRITPATKVKIIKMQENTGLSQTGVIERLVNNTPIVALPHGKEIAMELAVANENMNQLRRLYVRMDNQQIANKLDRINANFTQAKNILSNILKGDVPR